MGVVDTVLGIVRPVFTKVLLAAVIIFVGLVVGKLAGRAVQKVLAELDLDSHVRRTTGLGVRLEKLISAAIQYLIYIVFVIWALQTVGLGAVVLNILSAGIIFIIFAALILSIRDLLPNAAAGLILYYKGYVKKDDWVEVDNIAGRVLDIDLTEIRIETRTKDILYVPNSVFLRKRYLVKKS
jgi:small conductance mechanosensitive channel